MKQLETAAGEITETEERDKAVLGETPSAAVLDLDRVFKFSRRNKTRDTLASEPEIARNTAAGLSDTECYGCSSSSQLAFVVSVANRQSSGDSRPIRIKQKGESSWEEPCVDTRTIA